MNKAELIQHLMDMVNHIPYRDKESLLVFQKKAEETITDLFGEESHYHQELHKIRFVPSSFYSTEDDYLESWKTGVGSAQKLLENMLKEADSSQQPPQEESPSPPKGPQQPSKDSVDDYLLELEFAPESQTINLDEMDHWQEAPQPVAQGQNSPKTESPEIALPKSTEKSEKSGKSKVEQLEAVIEKIKMARFKETTALSSGELSPAGQEEKSFEATRLSGIPPVLVVYGAHEMIKDEVLVVLERLGFPVLLSPGEKREGLTVFKRFLQPTDICFAVVILTGDDFAYSKDQTPDEAKLRARQSVVFDLGLLVGKLGRDRVFVLYQETRDFELPTDFFDVLYAPYSKVGGWQLELLRQLKKAGYPVDANKII